MEYDNLSLDEIRQQIDETENKQSELKRLLEVRRQEGMGRVAQQVQELIQNAGYAFEEIEPFLSPKRRRGVGVRGASNRQYRRYIDPENPDNVYVRGVLPGWMKDKMQSHGLDPSSKDDRETFKSSHMRLEEG